MNGVMIPGISAGCRVGKAISMSMARMMRVPARSVRRPAQIPRGTPTAKAMTTDASPTPRDTRVPQMMRLRRSRPYSSQFPARGPLGSRCQHRPGRLRRGVLWASQGAVTAAKIMAAARTAPTVIGSHRRTHTRRAPRACSGLAAIVSSMGPTGRRMATPGASFPRLPVRDPGVDDGVHQVDDEVDRDDHGEHSDGSLGQGVATGPLSPLMHPAEPPPA